MLPHFDYSISLGTLGSAVFVVYTIALFKGKIDMLLDLHTRQLEAQQQSQTQHEKDDDRKFQAMETRMVDLIGNVQRLIGQSEVRIRGDRRTT